MGPGAHFLNVPQIVRKHIVNLRVTIFEKFDAFLQYTTFFEQEPQSSETML